MNKDQEAKINTVNIVVDYLAIPANTTLVNSFLTMKHDVEHFIQDVKELNRQIGISQTDFTGITTNQTDARHALAKFIATQICAISARYARSISDSDLELIFKHTEAQLKRYALSGIIPLVDTIITKSDQLLADVPAYATFTGITNTTITDATTLRDKLNNIMGQAKLMKRAVSRSKKQIDVVLNDIFHHDFDDLLDDAQHFSISSPDFIKGLKQSMNIDDLPTEHTGINGFGHDKDGNVIIGGSITNLDLPERTPLKFDNLGYYHDDTFQWGTYRFKYSHPDFQDQIITITIPRGKKIVQNVIMLPH